MSLQKLTRLLAASLMIVCLSAQAQQSPSTAELSAMTTITTDISYAMDADRDLKLDLYLPKGANNPPLIVYVHGGAWRGGSKDSPPIAPLIANGYAMASLDFHLSGEAMFPAQIHDIKAAIRFLRGAMARAAKDPSPVLLIGETGTGKEWVAKELHRASQRKGKFVAVNCAALTAQLIESP